MSNRTSPSARKRVANRGISARVLQYLDQHADVTVYRNTMASDLGISEDLVTSTMYSIKSNDRGHAATRCEVVVGGQAWIWHSQSPNQRAEERAKRKRVFGEIGTAKDGGIIIEDADSGQLYKAVEL